MKYQAIYCAAAILALRLASSGQAAVSTQILAGECAARSQTAEGPLGSDLAKRQSHFFCDTAVFTTFNDVPGHTLINFSQQASRHATSLGFAGRFESSNLENGSMMQVNTVYLKPGEASIATVGSCSTVFEDQRLKNLVCGVNVDEAGRRTTALIVFDVAPNQSLRLGARPSSNTSASSGLSATDAIPDVSPDEGKSEVLPNGTETYTLPDGRRLERLTGRHHLGCYPSERRILGHTLGRESNANCIGF